VAKLKLLHSHSPFRIFGVSGLLTIGTLLAVLFGLGTGAALITLILIAVEVAFSFDNAIVNAKTLSKLSRGWQMVFLTFGMIIAVFGMRIIFPILLVAITAHLSWANVVDLALHHPHEYAHHLELAHPSIAAFGGAFLLMLSLEFFMDKQREAIWLHYIERPLQRISKIWVPTVVSAAVVGLIAALPGNHNSRTVLVAGMLGILTHIFIEMISNLFGSTQEAVQNQSKPRTGMAAFWTFIYLEVLDASFSFDGVLGAFAITSKVVLIAAGLGVGALWVRSITVFMVRRDTLKNYIYLDHGAHYTIFVLACVLLLSIFWNVPDVFAGVVGIGFIGSSVVASLQERRHREA